MRKKRKRKSRMQRAIDKLGKASGGRKWVLIWQSTHPEVSPTKMQVAFQNASKEQVTEMFEMALASQGGRGGD